ncbi:MAG: ATP-binding cassette domain-containing protein [Acidobacteria bacterium]|nr:ATP-binding cassette domain-containing protein [Acidobacteriota bacterium]
MNSPYLSVSNLHKAFGANKVLQGVNLEIDRGDSLVILGGSGSGKSVLLKHMIGLLRPDSGYVHLGDVALSRLSESELFEVRKRFGMSFQEAALFDSYSVFENVAFPIRRHRRNWSQAQVKNRVDACLDLVGMPNIGALMPSELSGGMRRRVGFARSIALEPEILLFDEPTTGLDPVMTSVLNKVIIDMRENLHATTITITHDLNSAREIATKVAMLFKGQMIECSERETFFASTDPLVRQFLEGRPDGPLTEALMK